MDTASMDLGLQSTGSFLTKLYTRYDEEKQPFIIHDIENDNGNSVDSDSEQTFYQKYKMDILKLRTPFIMIIYHYLGYLYTVPYLPINEYYIIIIFIPITIILFMTYLTYFISAWSHPGAVPKEYKLWDGTIDNKPIVPLYSQILESKIMESGYTININDKEKLFCKKCKLYRPLRAHHCSICNDCICRMDHHCWFLNNCVGINNHRYFIQFIVWLAIILIIYQITYYISKQYIFDNESYIIYIASTFMFYLGIIIQLFLIVLFFTNFRCILNNQTYLEQKIMWDQMMRYGYVTNHDQFHQGSWTENFLSVFGSSVLSWILPIPLNKLDLDKRMMHNARRLDLLPCNRYSRIETIIQPNIS